MIGWGQINDSSRKTGAIVNFFVMGFSLLRTLKFFVFQKMEMPET